MIQISLGSISAAASLLTEFESKLQFTSLFLPTFSTKRLREITHEKLNIETMKVLLEQTIGVVDEMELEGTKKLAKLILADLNKIIMINLSDNLRKLRGILEEELRKQWVIHIPKHNAWWFDNKQTFGDDVLNSFPSAVDDILEAGNCYALDRSTASVFHCMRILEHGLNALAKDVGVSFELTNWGNIIDQIESEIKKLRNAPKTPEKDERLQFVSEAAKEFTYFKDGWRNHVSHRRTTYDMFQALSVLTHVQAFMKHLSTKLKEVT